MKSDPTPRDVVEYAMQSSSSLTKAASDLSRGHDSRNLWRRAQKFIYRHALGKEMTDLFFKRGASCDIMLSARLVCEPDEMLDLITGGGVPLSEICKDLPNERSIYQVIYNRIERMAPGKIKSLKKKKRHEPSNFFNVSPNDIR